MLGPFGSGPVPSLRNQDMFSPFKSGSPRSPGGTWIPAEDLPSARAQASARTVWSDEPDVVLGQDDRPVTPPSRESPSRDSSDVSVSPALVSNLNGSVWVGQLGRSKHGGAQ